MITIKTLMDDDANIIAAATAVTQAQSIIVTFNQSLISEQG